ncbi:MAG: hypothetical protein RJA98_1403 [Pseudomonadota bacterium]|jgi:toxin CcdB
MARFDVYANPDLTEREHTPYLLDVQNDFIDGIDTRVVIPLRWVEAFGPRARDLNPLLRVIDNDVVLDTATIGAVPLSALTRPVQNLNLGREAVFAALDTLFGAY